MIDCGCRSGKRDDCVTPDSPCPADPIAALMRENLRLRALADRMSEPFTELPSIEEFPADVYMRLFREALRARHDVRERRNAAIAEYRMAFCSNDTTEARR